ncbi:MAG: hypothetical protein EB072_13000 [Betaproteobacteria bacterium]|nr:hypothetical protein [Betaproteobacteria bacterium]
MGDFHLAGSLSASNNLFVGGNALIAGSLTALGDFSYIDTIVSVTSALSVVNTGTGPALTVKQTGAQPVAVFYDDNDVSLKIKNNLQVEFFDNTATNFNTVAQGFNTSATGVGSHSEGVFTLASGTGSHAQGYNSVASGNYAYAQGIDSNATAFNSTAIGKQANAVHPGSTVISANTNALNSSSFANNSINAFASGGIYLFNNTTIGNPFSATAFSVNSAGDVYIGGAITSWGLQQVHLTPQAITTISWE